MAVAGLLFTFIVKVVGSWNLFACALYEFAVL